MKSKNYEEFVEKFKPKKTTDDCYTPEEIYSAIRDWVCQEYGVAPESIIRPFWPEEDYQKRDYPNGCVVLDNPPFSILSQICEYYLDKGIKFFLFAPSLTILSSKKTWNKMNHLICDCCITYQNGAVVKTSFVTNLGADTDIIAQTCPELTRIVNNISETIKREKVRDLPKYEYPAHVVTAAMMQRLAKNDVQFTIKKQDCTRILKLDAQIPDKKGIFGSGLLLSESSAAEKVAAEKVAAERAAAERAVAERAVAKEKVVVYELSQRELDIVAQLGKDTH